MNIGIIGTGIYSVAIAMYLANNKDNEIILWSEDKSLVESFLKDHKLTKFTANKIPKNIKLTNNINDVLNGNIVFLMTSIKYLEEIVLNIKDTLNKRIPVCIGTKGIYNNKTTYEIVSKYLKNPLIIMAGPTFAIDILNKEKFGLTIATKSKNGKRIMHTLFSSIKLEDSKDLIGVCTCSYLKNIYAIGSGIIKGLGFNESTEMLYLNLVLKEYYNILFKKKALEETYLSLAGIGDLILTCTSKKSRNYTYGTLIGEKKSSKKLEEYLKNNTVEGVETLKTVKIKNAKILNTLYEIVINNEKPTALIDILTDNH